MVQNQTYASMRDNAYAKVFTFASRLTAPTFTSMRFHRVIILRFPPIATRLARACGRGRRPRRPASPRAFPCARRAEDVAGTSRAGPSMGARESHAARRGRRALPGGAARRAQACGRGRRPRRPASPRAFPCARRAEDVAPYQVTPRTEPLGACAGGRNSLRPGRGRTRQARPSHRDTATHRGYCGNFIGQWRT